MIRRLLVLLLAATSLGAQAAPFEIVVDGTAATVALPGRALVRSIRFAPGLVAPTTVTADRLRLAAGARIAYARNAKAVIQTIAADLELLGDATFANDNPWTHEAHVLSVDGRISGTGTLVVDGEGDGGVDLRGDSTRTFGGAIRVDGGMLIARGPGSLGPADTSVTLRGGKLFLPGVTLPQSIAVEHDAMLWLGGQVVIDGDLTIDEGATLTIDTGGGNPGRVTGTISGDGALKIRGGGRAPFAIGGSAPSRLRGPLHIEGGTLTLAKPDGVVAISSDVIIGGAKANSALRLDASEQIDDDSRVVIEGPGRVVISTYGHHETVGPLVLRADAVLRCGDGPDVFRFAASTAEDWTGTLVVEGWRFDEDRVVFGETASALTAEQVARLGFRDPAGQAPGLLHATILEDGTLSPGQRVWPRSNVPFPIDGSIDRKRRAIYETDGLAQLCQAATPLRAGDTLSFFGDSITWLGGFTDRIEHALRSGSGTEDLGVRVRNRGINGGGVRDLRDGSAGSARTGGVTSADGDAPQAPFAEVLRADGTTVAVVLIGINDVNWKGTTDQEFETALRTLCRSGAKAGVRVVLATLMLDGERPDGSNPNDPHIERLAAITRRVSREEDVTRVDLRIAVIAWLQNHNRQLRLDGTLDHESSGLLTRDGIHLSDRGNDLVAELLADGIRRALADR